MNERKNFFLLFAAGILSRLLIYLMFADRLVVGNDQMRNITLAQRFASEHIGGVLDTYWTPLYPFLIGVLSLFIDSLVLPSVIISIIAGALAVPLTYFLVKEFFDDRAAWIAAVIAVFFPHLINSFFAIGTENIYLLWMNAALLTAWRGLKSHRSSHYLLTGLLLGLGYLTRPEAFAYPFYFSFLALAVNLASKRISIQSAFRLTGALMIGFILLAAPYLVYLHEATGVWTISEKTNNNTIATELGESEQIDAPTSEAEKNDVWARTSILYQAVQYNLKTIHQTFPAFIPPFLLMLIGLALFREAASKDRLRSDAYLILFCLVTVFGYALAAVQIRYFYFLLPVFFGWIARGILQLESWWRETFEKSLSNDHSQRSADKFVVAMLLLIFLYTLPLDFFMRPPDQDLQSNAYEERDAGIWMRNNAMQKSPLIFSASTRPVFYAQGRQQKYDGQSAEEIFNQIRIRKPDFIVTSERSLKRHPALERLDELLQKSPDIECVYENTETHDYPITIYRFKSPS